MRRFALVSVLATMVAGVGLVACGDDDSNDTGQMSGGDGDAAGDGDDGAGDGDATGDGDRGGDGDQGGDGDDNPGDGDAGDGDAGGDGDDQPSANAGTCETTTQPSTNAVSETQKNETYPTPMGGTVQDGVYVLSSFNVYSPAQADSNKRAWLLEVAGNKIASINVSNSEPKQVIAGTFSTSGSTITFQISCPGAMSMSLPYTATANEIRLFDPDEPNVQVYTKQ